MKDVESEIDALMDFIFGDKEPPDLIDVRTATEAAANAQLKSRWRTLRAEARTRTLEILQDAQIGELNWVLDNTMPNHVTDVPEIVDRIAKLRNPKDDKQDGGSDA